LEEKLELLNKTLNESRTLSSLDDIKVHLNDNYKQAVQF